VKRQQDRRNEHIGQRDRRRGRRIKLGERDDLLAMIETEGTTRFAKVIDISEGGMRVQFDHDWTPVRGATFERVSLLGDAIRTEITLPKIELRRGAHFNETRSGMFIAADDETRAALWYAMQRVTYADVWPDDLTGERHLVQVPPKIPARGQYTEQARIERLEWMRKSTGAPLGPMQTTRLTPEKLTGNLENMIGAVEVPVGLAGPLLFRGREAKGYICAPLATTEGALVASATRGATAISRSGGVVTRVVGQRMMRVPLFVLSTLHGAFLFADWVREHVEQLREQTRLVSRHADLLSVETVLLGRMVHVYFHYQTGDAAGQNMTTVCTWKACQWLMQQMARYKEVVFESFIIDGGISGDKKVTYASFIGGRGTRVIADAHIDGTILKHVLKVSPEELYAGYNVGLAGCIHAGTIGFNINIANVIAAIFTATGQDIACVHESSIGQLHMQLVPDGLHISMVLPSIIIGTVGGGTHLPAQQSLLEGLGCAGAGKVGRLAEIIAGYCLALDLSTSAAIASGEFAAAHERLGRNRPVRWLEERELDRAFFEPAIRHKLGDDALTVDAVRSVDVAMGSSIVTDLTARKVSKLVGLLPRRIEYTTGNGASGSRELMLKVKPLDEEVILVSNMVAKQCGGLLAAAHNKHRMKTGFVGCHTREIAIYGETDPRFVRHVPDVYLTLRDDAREIYLVALERLRAEEMELLDSADDARVWSRGAIEAAVTGLAELHSVWLGREEELLAQPWIGHVPSSESMTEMNDLWDALAVHASREFPNLVEEQRLDRLRDYIATVPLWWPRLEAMPRTLIHNDFNPRNIAMRKTPEGPRLVAYDWELATLGVPQHDLAELFAFVLSPRVNKRLVDHLVEVHRVALERASGVRLDPQTWHDGYIFALQDLAINRFGLYMMAHTFRHYAFMERTLQTLWHLLDIEIEGKAAPSDSRLSARFRI
jgi:NADP-dependent 3-hydroxy-3-methylglutaryl-CoA reductase